MTKKKTTFAESIIKVENIVQDMETGNLDLTEMLNHYAKGVEILAVCHNQIKEAETKINELKESGEPHND